jgi:Phosphotransferase enzyme family
VNSQPQCERENWRAIVFNSDGTMVLLKVSEGGFVFPSVEISRWERWAENLTAALEKEWGCEAVCLFTLDLSQDGGTNDSYEIMECCRDDAHSSDTVWQPIDSLTSESFEDPAEYRIFERCFEGLDRYERDPGSPFSHRGSFAQMRNWTRDAIRPFGLELETSFRQYNASESFSLIRFETNGPAVWFKAVGVPNLREFPITLKLAELLPQFLPEVLATRPEWNAWLSREVEGTNLGETKEAAIWERAAAKLAELQIDSISRVDSILDAGAHDLRADRLFDSVDPFFEVVTRLMEQQTKVSPPALSREELGLLKLRLEDALTLLGDFGIPHTLGHLDLNPSNIVVTADGCVFLDWAEAYVGLPFFSFEYLLEHFRREVGRDSVFESAFVNAYRSPWQQFLSDDLTSEAFPLAPLTAVFAYAAGTQAWKDGEKLRDAKTGRYFRSLARRMNREAMQLTERRPACLS